MARTLVSLRHPIILRVLGVAIAMMLSTGSIFAESQEGTIKAVPYGLEQTTGENGGRITLELAHEAGSQENIRPAQFAAVCSTPAGWCLASCAYEGQAAIAPLSAAQSTAFAIKPEAIWPWISGSCRELLWESSL